MKVKYYALCLYPQDKLEPEVMELAAKIAMYNQEQAEWDGEDPMIDFVNYMHNWMNPHFYYYDYGKRIEVYYRDRSQRVGNVLVFEKEEIA